jgi:hypothetical protein
MIMPCVCQNVFGALPKSPSCHQSGWLLAIQSHRIVSPGESINKRHVALRLLDAPISLSSRISIPSLRQMHAYFVNTITALCSSSGFCDGAKALFGAELTIDVLHGFLLKKKSPLNDFSCRYYF